MKIVHVVYSLEMGGAEVLVAQLARIQRANGHDVSICAYSKLGPIGEQLSAEGFSIYVPGEAHPGRTMLRYLRHFRRLRPDVVHCHNPAPTLQAALPARLAGVGNILATRHSLVEPPYDRNAEIKFSTIARLACNSVVGICEITAQNLRGAPWAATDKIVRVYNGVVPVDRTEEVPSDQTALQPTCFTLLFVGRLAAIKNLETLIRAFAHASAELPNMRLWIVGDGPVRPALESLTAELGQSDRIHFWGQRMDTAAFFSAADCFVMSSVSEGLPMSLLQAMSLGIPAITTDVGGMAEVLALAQSGLLAPVGDHAAYADAILRMATDAALRAHLSTNALTAYHQHFTLSQMDRAYMELYRRR
ncbi:MAG: glycosyltransferase [Acidobacteriaceae bacterium]